MEDTLLKYMNKRMDTSKQVSPIYSKTSAFGPIVTISREAGCSANDIAALLYKKINTYKSQNKSKNEKWRCINKEIIYDSASKLGLPARKIRYVFNSEKRSTIDEIVEALSYKYYKSDTVIRKTIVKIMKSYMKQGSTIVVGRAGIALSQSNNNALHIRLMAPMEWRVSQIKNKHEINESEAIKYIHTMDKKRQALINQFMGKNNSISHFDLVVNCQTMPQDEIVNIIFSSMLKKGWSDFHLSKATGN